jgi:hypothetical protein
VNEKTLTAGEVRAWLLAVDADLAKVAVRLDPLLTQQRQLEDRKALLQGLLRSFDQASENGAMPTVPARTIGSVARYVVDRAVEILRDEGRPLHINDLHAQFVERGFTVPGAGKPVNLIVHLRNSEEIVSPMRGVYGLVDQVGAVPRQTSRRRKGARSRARGRKN